MVLDTLSIEGVLTEERDVINRPLVSILHRVVRTLPIEIALALVIETQ